MRSARCGGTWRRSPTSDPAARPHRIGRPPTRPPPCSATTSRCRSSCRRSASTALPSRRPLRGRTRRGARREQCRSSARRRATRWKRCVPPRPTAPRSSKCPRSDRSRSSNASRSVPPMPATLRCASASTHRAQVGASARSKTPTRRRHSSSRAANYGPDDYADRLKGGVGWTWDTVAASRGERRHLVAGQGCAHRNDARLAVEHGACAVVVSNHGGPSARRRARVTRRAARSRRGRGRADVPCAHGRRDPPRWRRARSRSRSAPPRSASVALRRGDSPQVERKASPTCSTSSGKN